MHQLTHYDRQRPGRLGAAFAAQGGASSLIAVIWRRRWTLAGTVGVCALLAGLYLALATRVYSASAKVLVEQNGPEALGGAKHAEGQSESYTQTQADVLQSGPVLRRALDAVHFEKMNTFAKAGTDPIAWLRRSGAFKVDVARKSDVIVVSMESAWPEEAAAIANSIVKEYVAEQSIQKRAAGEEILAALGKEKQELKKSRDASMAAMQAFKRDNDVLSFGSDRGNTALERSATLAASLTTAEMLSIDLRAQLAAVKRALDDPAGLRAFVEAQQFKAKDAGDHEYDELRSQLIGQMLTLSTSTALEGRRNTRVMTLEAVVTGLKARVLEKERNIAQAHLANLSTQLAAAEENERELRKTAQTQRAQILALGPQAAEYAKLEADVTRIQKQCDLFDARIGEVTVNELGGPPLNVQFLEPAHAESKPIRPNKLMVAAAALMVGWVLGIGLALTREWRDARFQNPQEILSMLGTSVLASIPRINPKLSPVARGQIVHLDTHSPSAEAYRSIRTSLHLGACRDARTILVVSAEPGAGKSTAASNLAITFAQAGHRTLLIDCDMREPVQHMIFETDGSIGVTSVVAGESTLAGAIRPTRVAGLYLLPCGPVPANPSELLAGKRFGHLMRALVGTFDRIVIDSPPVMTGNDARIIAASADATLLVLRINQTTHRSVIPALDELERVGANVLGAVANDMPALRSSSYYRGSWQYASSAKRVMASIASQRAESGENGHKPKSLMSVDSSLVIKEPDWSEAVASASNGDKFRGENSAAESSEIARGAGLRNGAEW
jgi:capsular exopolysaccharide synthesis family protein